jgi:tetratricopeptide (TPR) repeat protein
MTRSSALYALPVAAAAGILLSLPGPLLAQAAAAPRAPESRAILPPAAAQTPSKTPVATPIQAPSAVPATQSPAAIDAAPTASPEAVGDSFSMHQRYQAAIAAYQKAAPSATVWNKMGIAYQMMFNVHDAARCYRESLKFDSHNAQVINNLATVYDSQKDYSEAEHLYRKALKLDPQSALVLKNLGTNLLAQHKYNRGWAAYQQALAIDPEIFSDRGSPQVQNPASVAERGAMNYYMALGCVRMGQTDCALQYLRMALDEGFTNPKKVASDVAFASLRDNPDFKQLLAAQANAKPQQAR